MDVNLSGQFVVGGKINSFKALSTTVIDSKLTSALNGPLITILLNAAVGLENTKINGLLATGISLAQYVPELVLAFIQASMFTVEDGYINAGLVLNS